MKVEPHPCFILHQRPYRETSSLLDIFSRDHGRVSLIAKGARRGGSRFSGLLNLYWRLLVGWQGKSELMTLTAVEPDGANNTLINKALIAGFYLNELIMRMLHQHESHPELFVAYDKTISTLADKGTEQSAIRLFEKHLLQSLGYGLILDHDTGSGMDIDPDSEYYYRSDYGPSLQKPSHSNYIKISGKTLCDINEELFTSEKTLIESKKIMRFVLNRHLNGRPLASRNLYQSYISKLSSE